MSSKLQVRRSRLNDRWHGHFIDSIHDPGPYLWETKDLTPARIFDDEEETPLPKPTTWIDTMPDPPSIPPKS